MSKFKVGDRVLVNSAAGFSRGSRGVVTDIGFFGWDIGVMREGASSAVGYSERELDLVVAVQRSGPVHTVTKKEIAQGKFGPVTVAGVLANAVMLDFAPSDDLHWHANDLTAAIETLTAIRDVLVSP